MIARPIASLFFWPTRLGRAKKEEGRLGRSNSERVLPQENTSLGQGPHAPILENPETMLRVCAGATKELIFFDDRRGPSHALESTVR